MKAPLWTTVIFCLFKACYASEFITDEPNNKAYNYTSIYQIQIAASPKEIWPHLEDLKSWMYGFDLTHYSGTPGEVGEVFRLYPNQAFLIQVTGKVTNQAMTFSNLPSTFNDESFTGVAVLDIQPNQTGSIVTLTMSRRFQWLGEGQNQMKLKRESSEFQNNTRHMWNGFLNRLKQLSEAGN